MSDEIVPEPSQTGPARITVAMSAVLAVLFVAFVAAMLGVLVRWTAHVTGVWPL